MLIINARIISMADRTKQREDLTNIAAFENGYIHIEGSIIKEMGSMANCPNDTDILDAKGRYVLPGFVDAHTHIGLFEDSVGFEGDDGNEAIDPVTPQLRAIDGIYHADRAFDEARQWGVTTVVCGPGSSNVICGQFAALKTWGRSVDEMIIKQPCALKVAFGENPKSVHNDKNRMPSTR